MNKKSNAKFGKPQAKVNGYRIVPVLKKANQPSGEFVIMAGKKVIKQGLKSKQEAMDVALTIKQKK